MLFTIRCTGLAEKLLLAFILYYSTFHFGFFV